MEQYQMTKQDDAIEVLDDLIMSLKLSHLFDDDEYSWTETIRNRLNQCAEYEKRIAELVGMKQKGMGTGYYGHVFEVCGYNQAIDDVISHMKGE